MIATDQRGANTLLVFSVCEDGQIFSPQRSGVGVCVPAQVCGDGLVLDRSSAVCKCPESYFYEPVAGVCLRCPFKCLGCVTQRRCTACRGDRLKSSGCTCPPQMLDLELETCVREDEYKASKRYRLLQSERRLSQLVNGGLRGQNLQLEPLARTGHFLEVQGSGAVQLSPQKLPGSLFTLRDSLLPNKPYHISLLTSVPGQYLVYRNSDKNILAETSAATLDFQERSSFYLLPSHLRNAFFVMSSKIPGHCLTVRDRIDLVLAPRDPLQGFDQERQIFYLLNRE